MFQIVVALNEGIKMLHVCACVLTLLYQKLKQVHYDNQHDISK